MVESGVLDDGDFDNDALAEVFGVEKKRSYCRSVSSTMSKKQVIQTRFGTAIAIQKAKESGPSEIDARFNQMHLDISNLTKVSFRHHLVFSSVMSCV